MAEILCRFIILHRQKCGIVAGKRSGKSFNMHRIESRARGRCKAGKSLNDDDILCDSIRCDAFSENFAKALLAIIISRFAADNIVVFAAVAEFFYQMELLYIS